MFAVPKNTADSKLETPANPFNLTTEVQKELDELKSTQAKLNKEKIEFKEKLEKTKEELSTITKKLYKIARKPDVELEALLKQRMNKVANKLDGIHCYANLEKQVLAIDLFPVEDLEAVKKVFHSFVDPNAMKISNEPLDGTFVIGGPKVFLEIDSKERANLIKGLQLAQAELDIPMSRYFAMC